MQLFNSNAHRRRAVESGPVSGGASGYSQHSGEFGVFQIRQQRAEGEVFAQALYRYGKRELRAETY